MAVQSDAGAHSDTPQPALRKGRQRRAGRQTDVSLLRKHCRRLSRLIVCPRQHAPLRSAESQKCFRLLVITASFLTGARRRRSATAAVAVAVAACAAAAADCFSKFSSPPLTHQGAISTLSPENKAPGDHLEAGSSDASRRAGGWRTAGLSGGDLSLSHTRTARVSLGHISEINCASAPSARALPFGIAMSTRKTSLTDRQTKNGTSKYVLERCASINEYYDIAFKVCISVSSSCALFFLFRLFFLWLLLRGTCVSFCCGLNKTGCTCSNSVNIDLRGCTVA